MITTKEELAGCIAVVKNLMITREIGVEEASYVFWDLADEVTDSAHYVLGTSKTIDKLLLKLNVECIKGDSHGSDKV